jgi:uncharacterized BrkB/YihY/UPF0761 family membrane protein
MYMLDAGSGDVMSPYASDNGGGDLMAYNAFPDGLSSTPLSSLGGGGGGGGGYQDQQPQQQQYQQQQQQPQQQIQSNAAQAQANVQAQARLQAQANQASQMAQAYTLAPTSGSLVTGSAVAQATAAPVKKVQESDPGYLETLWQKRRDVAKLCILALAVLLAISAHSAAWHYLREFIETAPQLSQWQELGLRIGYPAIVLIVLWNLKALQ